MEIRNVQKTGGSSLTLTLPKQWVNDFHVQEKDKVIIYIQKSGNLLIMPFFKVKQRLSAILSIDKLSPEEIQREIMGFYISGVDEIIVKSEKITFEKRQAVRDVLSRLIGFEILNEDATHIAIKNIFDLKKFSPRENTEKMFLIVQSMYKDCMEAQE